MMAVGLYPLSAGAHARSLVPEQKEKLDPFLSLLPPAIRSFIDSSAHWHPASSLLFPVFFGPPDHFFVDTTRLNSLGRQQPWFFYEEMGRLFSTPLKDYADFNEEKFLAGFVNAAERRRRGETSYVPSTASSDPTLLFLERLWREEVTLADSDALRAFWLQTRKIAESRDTYHFSATGNPVVLPRPAMALMGQVTDQTLKLLKKHDWEAGWSIHSETDVATQESRTKVTAHVAWNKLSEDEPLAKGGLFHFEPRMTMETRFQSPITDSDFLLLGGVVMRIQMGHHDLYVYSQGGYSARKLAQFKAEWDHYIPGVEGGVYWGNTLGDQSYIQLILGARTGLKIAEEVEPVVGGLFFKVVQ